MIADILFSDMKCLDEKEVDKIVYALEQLQDIHNSEAKVEFTSSIEIVRDWDGRIYVNGGSKKPIESELKIGKYLSRTLRMNVPVKVSYLEKPEDPMFRFRMKAEFHVLIPELVKKEDFIDAGVSLDFFHIKNFNTSAYVGFRSAGLSFGYDVTKNFGVQLTPSFVYTSLKPSGSTGVYFSF